VIREFNEDITSQSVLADLELFDSLLSREFLVDRFSGMVLDVEHVAPGVLISDLARAYRVADRIGLSGWLVAELKKLDSFLAGDRFSELLQRCVALEIAEHEFVMLEAVPEMEVRTGAKPDWTIRVEGSKEPNLEVTAVSIRKLMSDLNAFAGRLPIRQIIRSSPAPLYFEAIFDQNPRSCDPASVGRRLVAAGRSARFPADWEHDGVHGFVDLLNRRQERPQIISDVVSSERYLKSTRLVGDELVYTLAMGVSFKPIDAKIDEKKKSNKLDQLDNVSPKIVHRQSRAPDAW
jgi:hypothetical protein